jgi:alpha-mannosidase
MIPKLDIRLIEKRLGWLPKFFYEPVQNIEMEMAETMEHRRTPNLDGLNFAPITPGTAWGQEWGSAWFKGTYIIDKNFNKGKILLQVDTGGESIVYIDNKPTAAIDREHKEIPLSQSELAEGVHEILIESYAGHCIPEPDPLPIVLINSKWEKPVYKHSRLVGRNENAWHLFFDMSTLYQTARELPQDSLRRVKIFKSLSEAVNMITWETQDTKERNEGFRKAREHIAPLLTLQNSPTTPTVNIIGHAHIDIAWLWPLAETIRKCGRTFATQLRMMEEYPFYKFLQSQAQAYEYTEKHYPQVFKGITEAVKEGKWEVNGGMWVESDTNIPSAESLIRQFLVGDSYFLQKFGIKSNCLWLPDVFGYNGNLPQILRGCEIDYFITSKIGWNQTNRFPYDLFKWCGIDGTEVLVTYIKLTYNSYTDPENIWSKWREFSNKDLTDTIIDSVGYGDGGGGITMEHLEYASRLQDLEGTPKVKFGFVKDFVEQLNQNRDEYPTWIGELYLELHRGTLTSQAWTKRNNRKCEFLFRDAELLASIASLLGKPYPYDDFLANWKEFLTNQFHDILPGSSIARVYEDCEKSYGHIAKTNYDIINSSLDVIIKKLPKTFRKGNTKHIAVLNTLNWDRTHRVSIPLKGADTLVSKIGTYVPDIAQIDKKDTLCVMDTTGNKLPTQISGDKLVFLPGSIPGMGFQLFQITEEATSIDIPHTVKATMGTSETVLENDYITVGLDEHGQLVSVFDKESNREVLVHGQKGNVLLMAEDLPIFWDAWDIDRFYRKVVKPVVGNESMELISAGPIEARVRVTRRFGSNSVWTQDIILGCESKQIDFETKVQWEETHKLLKVAFPIDVNASNASYEIQGGYIQRATHENTSWEEAKFEVCGHKWVDISEEGYGAAVMNDCKYGYECIRNEIRLTLLKSATGPDPNADKGVHIFTYSLLPHTDQLADAEVCLRAHELNVPYRVYTCDWNEAVSQLPTKMQLFKVFGGQVFLQAVKKGEKDNSLILRFSELVGKRSQVELKLPLRVRKVYETNMIERDIMSIGENLNTITVDFKPFEIKTIKLIF